MLLPPFRAYTLILQLAPLPLLTAGESVHGDPRQAGRLLLVACIALGRQPEAPDQDAPGNEHHHPELQALLPGEETLRDDLGSLQPLPVSDPPGHGHEGRIS